MRSRCPPPSYIHKNRKPVIDDLKSTRYCRFCDVGSVCADWLERNKTLFFGDVHTAVVKILSFNMSNSIVVLFHRRFSCKTLQKGFYKEVV